MLMSLFAVLLLHEGHGPDPMISVGAGKIAQIQKLIDARPDDFLAWSNLGDAALDRARISGDHEFAEQAEQAYRRVLLLRGPHAMTIRNLARALSQQHRFREAISLCRQLPFHRPGDQTDAGLLFDLHLAKGDYAQASALLDVLSQSDDAIGYKTRAAQLHAQLGFQARARGYLEDIQAALSNEDARWLWASTMLAELQLRHEPQQACSRALEVLAFAPDNGYARLVAARAKAEMGDWLGVVDLIRPAVAQDRRPEVRVLLARAYAGLGRSQDADRIRRELEEEIRAHIREGYLGHVRALLVDHLERDELSARDLDLALREVQEVRADRAGIKLVVEVLHALGRDQLALPWAQRLLTIGQPNSDTYLLAGIVHWNLGRVIPARHLLRLGLECGDLDSDSARAAHARELESQPVNLVSRSKE